MKGAIIDIEHDSMVRKLPCTPSVSKPASSARRSARTMLFKQHLEVSKELVVPNRNDVITVNRHHENKSPESSASKSATKTRQRERTTDLIIYNSSVVSRTSPTNDTMPAKSFKFASSVPILIPVPPDGQPSPRTFGSVHASPLKLPGYIPSSKSPLQFPAYAGAKFSDPPSPKVLPKPPVHWFGTSCGAEERSSVGYISGLWLSPVAGADDCQGMTSAVGADDCQEMTSALKSMLKVQC